MELSHPEGVRMTSGEVEAGEIVALTVSGDPPVVEVLAEHRHEAQDAGSTITGTLSHFSMLMATDQEDSFTLTLDGPSAICDGESASYTVRLTTSETSPWGSLAPPRGQIIRDGVDSPIEAGWEPLRANTTQEMTATAVVSCSGVASHTLRIAVFGLRLRSDGVVIVPSSTERALHRLALDASLAVTADTVCAVGASAAAPFHASAIEGTELAAVDHGADGRFEVVDTESCASP